MRDIPVVCYKTKMVAVEIKRQLLNLATAVVLFFLFVWLIKKLLILLVRTDCYQRWFAGILNGMIKGYNKIVDARKRDLFSQLRESLENVDGDILEIGAGPGANFCFYPEGSSVIALDPSKFCKEYFAKRTKDFPHVHVKRFILGCAEDMKELESQSVAAVVCTLTMCSMKDQRQSLREIIRVLKPGGKFFFLEHVADYPGTWIRLVQDLVMATGLWDLLFDCHCNSETWKTINEAGFKTVSYERFYASSKKAPRLSLLNFLSPHIVGYAET